MYLCRKCGAEFIDPLGGRCPVCGARVKPSWEEERAGEAAPPPETGEDETEVTFELGPAEEETPKPAPQPRRSPEAHQPVDRFPDTGVYGPPKDYGGPAAAPAPRRRGATGVLLLSVIITVLLGVVAGVVFILSGDCDLEEAVGDLTQGFAEGVDKAVGELEPLWRDRAAEMREAGYEPVAGLPPDLWPAADWTLWFVGDDGFIYYEAVKDPELSVLALPGDVSLIGDLSPTPDGAGVLAVLRTGDGLGVYRLTTDGGSERLLDGGALYRRLMEEHSGEEDYARELDRARSSGELLRQPRLDGATGTLYVAAGPPGDYEIWTADPGTGKLEPFESYNTNLIPCLVTDGVLYYQHHSAGPGDPALVYAEDPATGDSDFIMTPGNAGGIISFDLGGDGTFAYLGVDYQDTPVVFYQRSGEAFSENLKVPGDAPESVTVGPGGVLVVAGAYEGRDNVIFFNLDDLGGEDMPQVRYWTGISDIRSACLGPPLQAP
jgi:hypothetical protein